MHILLPSLSIVNFKRSVLLLHFVTFFLETAIGQTPWETPLDELINIQHNSNLKCRSVFPAVTAITAEWSKCIDRFLYLPPEDNISPEVLEESEELIQSYTKFCADPPAYKRCWENIIQELNACEKNRGEISRQIYFTSFDNTCKNYGNDTIRNLVKAMEHGELCSLEYSTEICNATKGSWYSTDLCRRFNSLKNCEESVIVNCPNLEHRRILRRNLLENEKEIGCIEIKSKKNHTSFSPSSTSTIFSTPTCWLKGLIFFVFVFIYV